MPITLEKLFSPTANISFPFLGEIVHVTWAPFKYTGEMQDLFAELMADSDSGSSEIAQLKAQIDEGEAELVTQLTAGDLADIERIAELRSTVAQAKDDMGKLELGVDHRYRQGLRESLSQLLVSWDVLGNDRKPIPTDEATLRKLPPPFLQVLFVSLSAENQPDPQKAPPSDEPSEQPRKATAAPVVREISAPTRTGTTTSKPRGPSESRRSSSTSERSAPGDTRSGVSGP